MKQKLQIPKQGRLGHIADQAVNNDKLSTDLYIRNAAEKRHRPDVDRHSRRQEKTSILNKKAGSYRNSTPESGILETVFSNSSELKILANKIEELEDWQSFMKEANWCIRNKDKREFLKLHGASQQQWRILNTPDSMGMIGFSLSELTNNSKNIKRLKKCFTEYRNELLRTAGEFTIKGVRILKNVEAEQLQLFFQERLDNETRTLLKKYGFRWTRRIGAWQRPLNTAAIHAVKAFLNSL